MFFVVLGISEMASYKLCHVNNIVALVMAKLVHKLGTYLANMF